MCALRYVIVMTLVATGSEFVRQLLHTGHYVALSTRMSIQNYEHYIGIMLMTMQYISPGLPTQPSVVHSTPSVVCLEDSMPNTLMALVQ